MYFLDYGNMAKSAKGHNTVSFSYVSHLALVPILTNQWAHGQVNVKAYTAQSNSAISDKVTKFKIGNSMTSNITMQGLNHF